MAMFAAYPDMRMCPVDDSDESRLMESTASLRAGA
jgi:hypothetical protein